MVSTTAGRLWLFAGIAIGGGCVTTGPGSAPPPIVSPSPPPPAAGVATGSSVPTVVDIGANAVSVALELAGTPYRFGGETPEGFDCSGFIHYVYRQHGVTLPRVTARQYASGHAVDSVSELVPGDLVFFSTVGRGPTHVGLVVDDERFIHAPSSRGIVRIERLDTHYWRKRYLGARRPVTTSHARGPRPRS